FMKVGTVLLETRNFGRTGKNATFTRREKTKEVDMLKAPSLSIGIEEEYQIVHPQTRELTSYITQFLEGDHQLLREYELKPELHQSVVELGSNVCEDIQTMRRELVKMRRLIDSVAQSKGMRV